MRTELHGHSLAGRLVRRVRLEMLGRGFVTVDTAAFAGDGLLREFNSRRIILRSVRRRSGKFPHLVRYGGWLERLLAEALPEESLYLAEIDFRHEPAGTEEKEVDSLHADGSYLRSVCTLYGPTTIYREGCVEVAAQAGYTLLMTAMDRARALGVRCTLHRRPGAGPERALIVCSFERQM